MALVWPRRSYGKLVEKPGGNIQGPDYQTTGRSAEPPFPEIGSALAPDAIGMTSSERWIDYPKAWASGGYLLRPAVAANLRRYVVATRLAPMLEYPNRPTNDVRHYVEAMHAATEVDTLEFPPLFQLPTRLLTEAFVEPNPKLPPLALEITRDVPLPSDWFEAVRPMLSSIAGGRAFANYNYEKIPDEFFAEALRALACLPGTIRWRVPVAAAVYMVPLLEKCKLYYAISLSFQPRPDGGRPGDGEAYADWFSEETDEGRLCKTVQDILNVVRSKFPQLDAWDAVSAEADWQTAVQSLSELRVVKELSSWVKSPHGSPPSIDLIKHLRPSVMDMAQDALEGPTVARDFILPVVVGEDWKSAWQPYSPAAGGEPVLMTIVGQLVGPFAPLDPSALGATLARRRLDLPAKIHPRAQQRLSDAFSKVTESTLTSWTELIRLAFSREPLPTWFEEWAKSNAGKIAWRAAELSFLNQGSIDPTEHWPTARMPGAAAAMHALLHGEQPERKHFDELLRSAGDFRETAVKLAQRLLKTAPEESVRLAVTSENAKWLDDCLTEEALSGDPALLRGVAAVVAEGVANVKMMTAVLIHWDKLTYSQQTAVRRQLSSDLGTLSPILFGSTVQLTDAPVASWVWPIARTLCLADKQRRRHVVEAAARSPEMVSQQYKSRLLYPLLESCDFCSADADWSKTLRFALELRARRSVNLPEISEHELAEASLWLPLLSGVKPAGANRSALHTPKQLLLALLYEPHMPELELDASQFWKKWLPLIATPERELYHRYLKGSRYYGRPFWRFCAGWSAVDRLREDEIRIISDHNLQVEYFRAVLEGAPVDVYVSRLLNDWNLLSRLDPQPSPHRCRELYNRFRRCGDVTVVDIFWRFCLHCLPTHDLPLLLSTVARSRLAETARKVIMPWRKLHVLNQVWFEFAVDLYKDTTAGMRQDLLQTLKAYPRLNSI